MPQSDGIKKGKPTSWLDFVMTPIKRVLLEPELKVDGEVYKLSDPQMSPYHPLLNPIRNNSLGITALPNPFAGLHIDQLPDKSEGKIVTLSNGSKKIIFPPEYYKADFSKDISGIVHDGDVFWDMYKHFGEKPGFLNTQWGRSSQNIFAAYVDINYDLVTLDLEKKTKGEFVHKLGNRISATFPDSIVSYDSEAHRFVIFNIDPIGFDTKLRGIPNSMGEYSEYTYLTPKVVQVKPPEFAVLKGIYNEIDSSFRDKFNHPDGGILIQQNFMWGEGKFHSVYVNFNLSEINKKFGTTGGDFVLRLIYDGLSKAFGEGKVFLNAQGTSFTLVGVDASDVNHKLAEASVYVHDQIVADITYIDYEKFADVRANMKASLIDGSFGVRLSSLVNEVKLGDVFKAIVEVKKLVDQKNALKPGENVPSKLVIGSEMIEAEIAFIVNKCWPEVEAAIKGATNDFSGLYAQELRSLYDPETKTIAGVDPKKVNAVILLGLMQLDKESIAKAEFMQDHYSDPVVTSEQLKAFAERSGKLTELVAFIEGQEGYVGKAKYVRGAQKSSKEQGYVDLLDRFLGRLERDPHGYGILDKMDGRSEKGLIHQFWDKITSKDFFEARKVYFELRQKMVDYYFQTMVSHYNPSIKYVSRNDPQAFEKVWDHLLPFGKHVFAIGIEGDNFYALNDVKGGFDDAQYREVVDGITYHFEKHIGLKPVLTLMRAGDAYILFVAMPETKESGEKIVDLEGKIEAAKAAFRKHFKTRVFQPRHKVSSYEFSVEGLTDARLLEVGLKLMKRFDLNVIPSFEKGILYLPTEDANGVKITADNYRKFLIANDVPGSSQGETLKRMRVWRYDSYKVKVAITSEEASILSKSLIERFNLVYSPVYSDGSILLPQVDKTGGKVAYEKYVSALQEAGIAFSYVGNGESFVFGPKGVVQEALSEQCALARFERTPTVSVNLTGLNLANFEAFKVMVEDVIPDDLDRVKDKKGEYKDGFEVLPFKLHAFYSMFLPVLDVLPKFARKAAANMVLQNVRSDYFYYPVVSQYLNNSFGINPSKYGETEQVAEAFKAMRENVSRLAVQFGVEPSWLIRMLTMSQHDALLFNEWVKDSGQAHTFNEKAADIEALKKQMWDIVDPENVGFRKHFEAWFKENWNNLKYTKAAAQLMQQAGIGNRSIAKDTLKSATPNVAFSVLLILFMESMAEHIGYEAEDHPVMHLTTVVWGQEVAGEIEKRVVAGLYAKYNPGSGMINMPIQNFSTLRFLAQKFVHLMRGLGAARLGAGITGEALQAFGMSQNNILYHGLTTTGAVAPAAYMGHYFNNLKSRFAEYGLVHTKANFWTGVGVRLSWTAFIGMGIDILGNELDPLIHGDIEANLLNQQYAKLLQYNRDEGLIASFFSDRDVSFMGRLNASLGYVAYNLIGNNITSWGTKHYLYTMDKYAEKSLNMGGAVSLFVYNWSRDVRSRLLKVYSDFLKTNPKEKVLAGGLGSSIAGLEKRKITPEDLFVTFWNQSVAEDFASELKQVKKLAGDWDTAVKLPMFDDNGELSVTQFKALVGQNH